MKLSHVLEKYILPWAALLSCITSAIGLVMAKTNPDSSVAIFLIVGGLVCLALTAFLWVLVRDFLDNVPML